MQQLPIASRPACAKRTLETLKRDYAKFRANGGNIRHAKNFNNVIGEAMFDIPLDQVCFNQFCQELKTLF